MALGMGIGRYITRRGMATLLGGVLVCVLIAAPTTALATQDAGAPPAASAASLHTYTDDQLSDLAARLDGDAQRVGLLLLQADASQGEVAAQRDEALLQLQAWLAEAYKSDSSTLAARVIAAGGLKNADDGIRLVRAIGKHRSSILRSLDDAEAQLDMGTLRRAQLIKSMTGSQAQLDAVRVEQERRATIRGERRAERERAAAVKAAEAAEQQAMVASAMAPQGALVAMTAGGMVGGATAGSISPQVIDAYLMSKGSPMAGQGVAFVQSGMRWQVDPRLLVAIAGAESNFGQITCGPNNAWGWACPNDPESFATWAAGIDTVTKGLRSYYLDEGRTSVSLIQQKYCPVGAANDPTGLNNHWSTNVTKFLTELGGNPGNVGPGPSGGVALPDIGGLGLVPG